MFEDIGNCEQVYAPQLDQVIYPACYRVVELGEGGYALVVPKKVDHSEAVDDALRLLAFSMFRALYFLVENSQLYALQDKEVQEWL